MHNWSRIRQKLEQEYLAQSLRGRLTYFVTAYHGTHDSDEGRAAVRLDGAEILKSNYYDRMAAQWQHYYAADKAQRERLPALLRERGRPDAQQQENKQQSGQKAACFHRIPSPVL